jgi:hypothetical protein
MRQIPLSQSQLAVVDDEDFALLNDFKWCYRGERGAQGYAVRHHKIDGKDRLLYMHRQVVGSVPDGHEVIFLNHDRLDCRKANLRVVTKLEARQHHRVRSDSKSGVKGVRHNPETDTWSAYTYRHGHCYHVGTFYSPEQAQAAYEADLRKENPDLHSAPARVERTGIAAPDGRGNPDVTDAAERR